MASWRTQIAALGLLAWAAAPAIVLAQPSKPLMGSIVGIVSDGAGQPQMGAQVYLLDRFQRLLRRVSTDGSGQFVFPGLLPSTYSVRVTLGAFMPALRPQVAVQSGTQSYLAVSLASIISSTELVYSAPQTRVMSDDWVWVLRSSIATRPGLRFGEAGVSSSRENRTLFRDSKGFVRLSAGNTPQSDSGSTPDMATAFALATSLLGTNQLQFSGTVGYGMQAGTPSASLRTRYSRQSDALGANGGLVSNSPEVSLTVRQLFLGNSPAFQNAAPALRTMAMAYSDRLNLLDNSLEFLYGGTMESVSFYDRVTFVSPFARVSYRLSDQEQVQVAYSSGLPPEELLSSHTTFSEGPESGRELGYDLNNVSAFPRVSIRDRRAQIQRTENIEVAYHRNLKNLSYSVSLFQDVMRNGAVMMTGDWSELAQTTDVLADPFSRSAFFNIGSTRRRGLMGSVAQQLPGNLTAQLSVGYGGELELQRDQQLAPGSALGSSSAFGLANGAGANGSALANATVANDLRQATVTRNRAWASTSLQGTLPGAGTKFRASYLHTNSRNVAPTHRYLTHRYQQERGLNVLVRQPLPHVGVFNGRVEAMLELRNVLNEGLQSFTTVTGKRMLLTPAPRTIRGGLSFIF